MPADREQSSTADLVFTAVSPALIMLMVGSLVFFLITVLPTGEYKERLLYTTFFFVFGAVLVARIAIQFDAARASVYGLGLAIVTFIALSAYVEYPSSLRSSGWLVNIGLMGLIWWSANKLAWDCTHVDENRDASGRGLLAASGLNEEASKETVPPDPVATKPESEEPTAKKRKKKKRKQPQPSAFSTWTAAWWKHHKAQKVKPHTPGVWVLYFSLAALPLFAIGQSLIPAEDDSRRRAAFLQMAVYVGSGLGLLVTTSLLGLRRYLRQRKAKMPAALTAGWLGLGGVLIAFFLVVGAFLPRPYSEVPWFGLPQSGKSERDASDYAQLSDSAGKGEGADGDVTERGDGKSASKNGDKSKSGSGKGDSKGGGKSDSKGGDNAKGDSKDKSDSKGDSKDKSDSKPTDKSDSGRSGETEREAKEPRSKSERGNNSRKPPETKLGAIAEKVGRFLKWIVIAIVVILIIVGVALLFLRYLAPFTAWARNLLDAIKNWCASLFGKKVTARREAAIAEQARGPVRPPPFTEYSNPFADGSAERREPGELVEYTFEALDAWAWDRGQGRQAAETPLEFAARLGVEFPDHDQSFRRLANLYARTAYAFGELPTDTKSFLEQFWEELVRGAGIRV